MQLLLLVTFIYITNCGIIFLFFSPVKSVIFLMFSLPVKFVVFSLVFAFLFLFLLCYFSVFCFSCVISLFFVSLVCFLHKKNVGFISCVFPSSIFVLQATYSTLLIRQWKPNPKNYRCLKLAYIILRYHMVQHKFNVQKVNHLKSLLKSTAAYPTNRLQRPLRFD